MKTFKCRASKIGELVTGFKKITQEQIERISELESERDTLVNKNGNKVKWTDNKEEELKSLKHLAQNPQLGETAKTYLKEWVISQISGKEKRVKTKYFEHGINSEEMAINRAEKYFNCTFNNRQVYLENDFFTGCYDASNDELVIDTKCPYDEFTFPYFEPKVDKEYYGQLQIYMDLTGLEKASLVYCLENHSDDEIDKLAQRLAYESGEDEPTIHHWKEAKKYLTYDNLPDSMRIKTYEFIKDDSYLELARQAVIMSRQYINDVLLPLLRKSDFNEQI